MKQYHILIAFMFFLLLSACTKENIFLEKPTWTALAVNTTSATKTFEVWLDDELLQDRVNLQKALSKNILAGEHRLRIAESPSTGYFIDTLLNFDWLAQKRHEFSLIELDPAANPLFFTGFPEDLPAPENDFVTVAFINTDTTYSYNRKIDLRTYDRGDPTKLYVELKGIPYGTISPYYKLPVADIINPSHIVLVDSETQEVLLDSRVTRSGAFNLSLAINSGKNTSIAKFYNRRARPSAPVYAVEPIFEATR